MDFHHLYTDPEPGFFAFDWKLDLNKALEEGKEKKETGFLLISIFPKNPGRG